MRLFVATTDVFCFHVGRSLSMSTTLTPLLTAFVSAGMTAALVGVIAMPLTPEATMFWIAAISPASSVADLPCAYDDADVLVRLLPLFAPPTSVK